MIQAAHGLRSPLVDRIGLGWQLDVTDAARPGVPQAHSLLVRQHRVIHAQDRNCDTATVPCVSRITPGTGGWGRGLSPTSPLEPILKVDWNGGEMKETAD